MAGEESGSPVAISSIEMVSTGGFALFFAWMFIAFFWLFCEFPPDVAVETRDFVQLFVFAAVPIGYTVLYFATKSPGFNVFDIRVKVAEGVCAALMPIIALIMHLDISIPLPLVCVANLLAGMAAASIQLSWLDVLSRLKTSKYTRIVGLSLFAGGLLFSIVAFTPIVLQPVFSIVFVVISVVLLTFASTNAECNDERAPLESIVNTWRFTREIEPSFFMFGVVFGITFVFLFNCSPEKVALGLIATLVGSLVAMIMSFGDKEFSITVYQRALVIVTACACIVMPFVEPVGQVACSCVVTAAWAVFTSVNYGYIVKKCVVAWDAPLFRQAPLRLLFPALGFAIGWAVATFITMTTGAHSNAFMVLRLTVAVLLVLTIMVFFPSKEHHTSDGLSPENVKVQKTVVTVDTSESDLFEARCAAVAKLYQLSPRETEILGYLAKGRNAAYIQEALFISPHTVKSHIYNIYRKLDIHSQQKLMDFVEDFPLD